MGEEEAGTTADERGECDEDEEEDDEDAREGDEEPVEVEDVVDDDEDENETFEFFRRRLCFLDRFDRRLSRFVLRCFDRQSTRPSSPCCPSFAIRLQNHLLDDCPPRCQLARR